MKFKAYERPDLEELELILEGSFLENISNPEHPDVDVDPGEGDENTEWN